MVKYIVEFLFGIAVWHSRMPILVLNLIILFALDLYADSSGEVSTLGSVCGVMPCYSRLVLQIDTLYQFVLFTSRVARCSLSLSTLACEHF